MVEKKICRAQLNRNVNVSILIIQNLSIQRQCELIGLPKSTYYYQPVGESQSNLELLAVIDEYRESLAIEVGRSFTAPKVVDVLRYLFALRGRPEHIQSDNGPEFVSRVVRRWLDQAEVGPLFIAKGSPWKNGYVKSFNARIRDEILNRFPCL